MTKGNGADGAGALLAALVRSETVEDVLGPRRFSDEQLSELVLGRSALTQRQELALALSAADRQRLHELRQLERAKALRRWRAAGRAAPRVSLHAAADDRIGPLTIPGDEFTVRLLPFDLDGKLWKILVKVAPSLVADTPAGFRLLDSEGVVWAEGQASVDGELTGYWERDESLWERAHRVELTLVPR